MSDSPRTAGRRVTVRASIAPLMAEARVSSGQVGQLLRGHEADVLQVDGVWLRVRGADGYGGWCHRGFLRDEGPAVVPLAVAWLAERRMSLGCSVTLGGGAPLELPLGALLDPDEAVVAGLAMNHRARARYFAADADTLVTRATELFRGAPYQWGGVTPWGADCSGFVQTMYALHGTQLPRDAWQQAECGRDVAAELSELRPGDLLFFSDRDDGRPTHVGLSLGRERMAHSSLSNGGFAIDRLDASDPVATGLRETFRFARRIW